MDGKFKIFVIVAIVVLAAAIAGSTFFIMTMVNKEPAETVVAVEEAPAKLKQIDLGDAILTNLSMEENNMQHFAKVQLSIGVDASDEEAVTAFEALVAEKSASIRSEIIDTIGEQTFSMLSNPPTGKVKLADELIPRLNQLLDTEMIKEIYYKEYFVQ